MKSGPLKNKTSTQTNQVSHQSQRNRDSQRELRKEDILCGARKAPLKKWVDYFEDFMDRYGLFSPSSRAVVAFSCGPDSVALSLLLKALELRGRFSEVVLIHVFHGFRQNAEREMDWAVDFARYWDFQLRIEKVSSTFWETGGQNFESRARKERYRLLWQYLQRGDKLYLGHHIDDSFEWSLHQMLRTTDVTSSLGIPIINGKKVRPLMGFSKSQLLRFLTLCAQDFCWDESNDDQRFARNWLRKGVINECRKFSSHYLKNYVYRSNALAKELGLLKGPEVESRGFSDAHLAYGRAWIATSPESFQGDLHEHFGDFKKILKENSSAERGKSRSRFFQLAQAHKKHASYPRGPFHFQGGVEAYLDWGLLFILRDGPSYWKKLDKNLSRYFKKQRENKGANKIYVSQIPEGHLKSRSSFIKWLTESQSPVPFIVFAHCERNSDCKRISSLLGPSLKQYRLLPDFSQRVSEQDHVSWWQVGHRFYDRYEMAKKRYPNHTLWNHLTFYALKFDNFDP